MSMITNDWLDEIQAGISKSHITESYISLSAMNTVKRLIYPPADDIFNAIAFYTVKQE